MTWIMFVGMTFYNLLNLWLSVRGVTDDIKS